MNLISGLRLFNDCMCRTLYNDVEFHLNNGNLSLDEIVFIVDYYYRQNLFNQPHLEHIVKYLLSRELTP